MEVIFTLPVFHRVRAVEPCSKHVQTGVALHAISEPPSLTILYYVVWRGNPYFSGLPKSLGYSHRYLLASLDRKMSNFLGAS